MKIVWICNGPTKMYRAFHGESGEGASWIDSILNYIVTQENIELNVIFFQKQQENVVFEKINSVNYYSIKLIKHYNLRKKSIVDIYANILTRISPDIIHVWGTEFPQVLLGIEAAKEINMNSKVVLNLQGMCAAIGEHYYAGLPQRVVRSMTVRDFIKKDNLKKQRVNYIRRSIYETNALKDIRYVIGRTDYDRAYSTMINPQIKYLVCNETLREGFYTHAWKYDTCKKYSIFFSQAYYPLKGLHFVLKAMALVKDIYPEIEINIAGPDIIRDNQICGKIKIGSYGKYLKRIIKKNDLKGHVNFIGYKSEDEMIQCYLNSNIFISASSTENESNSLGEAKILGMPVIASFVGGIGNRIKHREDGFAYQYDDIIMLARFIIDYFENPGDAIAYGEQARINELKIANRDTNIKRIIEIYQIIYEENKKF